VTSNLIASRLAADGHSRPRASQAEILNRKSKFQNCLAVLAVAAAMLAAGCGLTKPSKSAAAAGPSATASKADAKNNGKTSKNDTIPNAAAVGL
jgi:hypothetical protein